MIQLEHCSYCLPWVCVSLETSGQPYSVSSPLQPLVAEKTPELNEPTPAWAQATVGKALLFKYDLNLQTPKIKSNKHYYTSPGTNKSLTVDKYFIFISGHFFVYNTTFTFPVVSKFT